MFVTVRAWPRNCLTEIRSAEFRPVSARVYATECAIELWALTGGLLN